MKKQFNYVVARPYQEDIPDKLSIYTYAGSLQRGTLEEAKEFLKYVHSKEIHNDKYRIYKVKFKKVD